MTDLSALDRAESMTMAPEPQVAATVQRLVTTHANGKPDEWVWVPISDWTAPEFMLIRQHLRSWNPEAGLMLRSVKNAAGQTGTAMRIGRWNPVLRFAYEDDLKDAHSRA
jgi:hypothetical protein